MSADPAVADEQSRTRAMLFRPYVPRCVRRWHDRHPGKAHTAVRGTLVSADISGFTGVSERLAQLGRLGAEELTALLNSCFAGMIADVERQGGDVVKFGGDSLLVLFSGDDHTSRACRATLGMRAALADLRPTSAGRVRLRVSIGVHVGTFHLFLVTGSHRELLILGKDATTTVRCEAAAGPGEILLSPEAASRLDGSCVGESRPDGRLLRRIADPQADVTGEDGAVLGGEADLSVFVPEGPRDSILTGTIRGEHRRVTSAFLRFSGTDGRIDEHGPDAVHPLVDELAATVASAASRYGVHWIGSDLAPDGGKLILTAGAPSSSGEDEEAMLRTLRHILDRYDALPLRVGTNTGHVFAGDLGSRTRRTFTVMGDAVNLAARLMEEAGPGELVAADDVVAEATSHFEVTPLPPLVVKGRSGMVSAARVAGTAVGETAMAAPARLPLLGRSDVLARLTKLSGRVREGRGAAVEIAGESGLGKTRLIEELHQRWGGATYLAPGRQYETTTAYFPFRTLLRTLGSIDPEADRDVAGAHLRRWVEAEAPSLLPWLPLLAIPVGASVAPTPETDQIAPAFRPARLHRAVVDLLDEVLTSPVLLLFEDVHWTDEASRDLLDALGRRATERPWLVVATTTSPDVLTDDGVIRLALSPLEEGPARALTIAVAEDEDVFLSDQDLEEIVARAGGNPLFLVELVSASDAGSVRELPRSIDALVTARIDTLEPRDRLLLRHASVLGHSIDLDILRQMLVDEDDSDVDDTRRWDRLTTFVVRMSPSRVQFRHSLHEQVAYEGLSFSRRRDLHLRAGVALESREAPPELLSLHFHRAGDNERAWTYSVVAADAARTGHAPTEAVGLYRRALDSTSGIAVEPQELTRVWEALGDVAELTAQYELARSAYAAARRHSRGGALVEPRLLRKLGVLRERGGQYPAALRWYTRGLRLVDERDFGSEGAALRAELELAYAGVKYRQGRYHQSLAHARSAAWDAQEAGDDAALAHAFYLLDLGYTYLGVGDNPYRGRALPIFEQLGDLVGQANVLNNLGIAAYYEGRWDEALECYERSRQARHAAGDAVGTATQDNNIGEILSDQGRYDEAERLFRNALRAWRAARYAVGEALATSNLGRLATRTGRLDEAEQELVRALAGFRAMGADSFVLETQARQAERLLAGGDSKAALDLVDEVCARLEKSAGDRVLHVMLLRLRGHALAGLDDGEAARSTLEAALAEAAELGASFEAALAHEALAALARLRGDTTAGGDHERDARRLLQGLGVAWTLQLLVGD